MSLDTKDLGEEAVSQGAETGTSYLDGIKGRGTLQVVRGRNREVMELLGTWRPIDEDTDVSPLEKAAEEEKRVRFQGTLADPEAPDRNEVTTDVRISSHESYAFDAHLPEDEDGSTLRVFNFHPIEPTDVAADAA